MKKPSRKILVLMLLVDALLITVPVIATEWLSAYYRKHQIPMPEHWWFVPVSMGLGFALLIGLIVWDVVIKIRNSRKK